MAISSSRPRYAGHTTQPQQQPKAVKKESQHLIPPEKSRSLSAKATSAGKKTAEKISKKINSQPVSSIASRATTKVEAVRAIKLSISTEMAFKEHASSGTLTPEIEERRNQAAEKVRSMLRPRSRRSLVEISRATYPGNRSIQNKLIETVTTWQQEEIPSSPEKSSPKEKTSKAPKK